MKCSGVAAVWCPNHGDCICWDEAAEDAHAMATVPYAVVLPEAIDLDSPRCPLHKATSDHAQ